MQTPQIPKLRVPGIYMPGFRPLEVPLPSLENKQYNALDSKVYMRTFTDPLFNIQLRSEYANEERNFWTETAGRLEGAGIGAAKGAYTGAEIGAVLSIIGSIILTTITALTPIPGDEIVAGGALASALASAKHGASIGAKIGAGIGAVGGAIAGDYTTAYVMHDVLKDTAYKIFTKQTGRGLLNSLYAVGKSMDILGGGETLRAIIYAGVSGTNARENIMKAYGLTYTGREDYDFEVIREELGIDIGRLGNFVLDLVGDLVTDPGFVSAMASLKTGSTASKNLLKEAIDIAQKESDDINLLMQSAKINPKLCTKIRRAILEKDYSTIILELNKKPNKVTVTAVKKFVDEVNEQSFKYVSNGLYNIFKSIDNLDDYLTGKLFSISLPPVGDIKLAKKGIKLYKSNYSISKNSKLGKFTYWMKGNANEYSFEEELLNISEEQYNKDVLKFFNKNKDILDESEIITKDYTVNMLYNDLKTYAMLDKLDNLTPEQIKQKNIIKIKIDHIEKTITDNLSSIEKLYNKKILELYNSSDLLTRNKIKNQLYDISKKISSYHYFINIINRNGSMQQLKNIMHNIQRMFSLSKKSNKTLEEMNLRNVFNKQVKQLINLIETDDNILDTLGSTYYARLVKYVRDNIDSSMKDVIDSHLLTSSIEYKNATAPLLKEYDKLKAKGNDLIKQLDNKNITQDIKSTDKIQKPINSNYRKNIEDEILKLNNTINDIRKSANQIAKDTKINTYSRIKRMFFDPEYNFLKEPFEDITINKDMIDYFELQIAIDKVYKILGDEEINILKKNRTASEALFDYTDYVNSLEIEPSVAAMFRTDTSFEKRIINNINNLTYDKSKTFKYTINDTSDVRKIIKSYFEDIKKKYINKSKKVCEQIDDTLKHINELDNKQLNVFFNIYKQQPKQIKDWFKSLMVINKNNIDNAISYVDTLYKNNNNPIIITYLDYYINILDIHKTKLSKKGYSNLSDLQKRMWSRIEKVNDKLQFIKKNLYNHELTNDSINNIKHVQAYIRQIDSVSTIDNMVDILETQFISQYDVEINKFGKLIKDLQDEINKKETNNLYVPKKYHDMLQNNIKEYNNLVDNKTKLTTSVFDIKQHINNLFKRNSLVLNDIDINDYIFNFANEQLQNAINKFNNNELTRFSKSIYSNTISVLKLIEDTDIVAKKLKNYIMNTINNLDFKNMDDVRISLKNLSNMSSYADTLRTTIKSMKDYNINIKFEFKNNKISVCLDKTNIDITEYFKHNVIRDVFEKVKVSPYIDNYGHTNDIIYQSKTKKVSELSYVFDPISFKDYIEKNNIEIEGMKDLTVNINKQNPNLWNTNPDNIFKDDINFNVDTGIIFNKKATATEPKKVIIADNEASSGNEKTQQALITQLHMTKYDTNGKYISEETIYLDPKEFEELTTNGRYSVSDEAIEVSGIDLARLQQEKQLGHTKTLVEMKKAFEDFGCLDDDAVLVAHNGNGYDFGVIANNFYNDANEILFDETGKANKEIINSLFNANCLDSLQLASVFSSVGGRLKNVEIAKNMGIEIKTINDFPDISKATKHGLTEFIFEKDGLQQIEYYFNGKPLHDASADVQLTAYWYSNIIQTIFKNTSANTDFYGILNNPNNFINNFKYKKLYEINGTTFTSLSKDVQDALIYMLGIKYDNETIEEILNKITVEDIFRLSEDLKQDYIYQEFINKFAQFHGNNRLQTPKYRADNLAEELANENYMSNFEKFSNLKADFDDTVNSYPYKIKELTIQANSLKGKKGAKKIKYKKILSDIAYMKKVLSDAQYRSELKHNYIDKYLKEHVNKIGIFNEQDYFNRIKDYKQKIIDPRNVYIEELTSFDNPFNTTGQYSKVELNDILEESKNTIDEVKLFVEQQQSLINSQQNNIIDLIKGSGNIGYQQINKNYVQTSIVNTILVDEDFALFKNILTGNYNSFSKGNNYYMLSRAFSMIDNPKIQEAKNYMNYLYDTAVWQDTMIRDLGNQNIDAFYNILDILDKNKKEYNNIEDYILNSRNKIIDYLFNSSNYYGNETTITIEQVENILAGARKNFNNNFDLKISSNITNGLYNYIKTNIFDNIESINKLSELLDKTGQTSEIYNYFDTCFKDLLSTFRTFLSDFKSENKLYSLMPINLNSFSNINGIRPYSLAATNNKYTIKYSKEKMFDTSLSKAANNIFGDLYKSTNTPSTMIMRFGATKHGDMINTIINLLDMDSLEMLRLSRNTKWKDISDAHDLIWDYMLNNMDDPDYYKFIRVQTMIDSITEKEYSYINNIELYKKRMRNLFLINYLENKRIFTDIDPSKYIHKVKYETINNELNKRISHVKFNKDIKSTRFNAVKENINAIYDSNTLFNNMKTMYLQSDNPAKEFSNFFNNRKDLVLIYLDNNFEINLMNTSDINNMARILTSKNNLFSIISRDDYWKLINKTQPVVLPDWLKGIHKYLILPSKLFSLYYSLPYLIKNITSAYLQNMTANGHRPIKAINTLVQTSKDYYKWKNMYQLATSNKSIYEILGNFDDVNMNWFKLIENKNETFLKLLSEEAKDNPEINQLIKLINEATPEDIKIYNEISELANTNAAFSELTDIQRNLVINRNKNEEIESLRKKNHLTEDEKETLYLYNNNPNSGYNTWKDEYDALQKKTNKIELDYHRMSIVNTHIRDDGYNNMMLNIQKYSGMLKWMDFNEDIEIIFRMSMMREQAELGFDLSQATKKVMDTHFIYNDKSLAMKELEIIMPFVTYPIKAANLFIDLTNDYSFAKIMYEWNKYSWGDEDASRSNYLEKRKAQGDIPVKDRLLHLGNAFTESLMSLTNPLEAANDKLNPIFKPGIDAITKPKYPRTGQLLGPIYNPYQAIKESLQTNKPPHPGTFFGTSHAYYNYKNNYNKNIYRNYPQHSYLYNNLYTKQGYSRVAMNMQQTTLNNLKYRVGSILYNTRYHH